MTSYGSDFTDFDLTKSGDTYHVKFVIVGDTVINVTAEAKITNKLTDTLVTTSNTDETIEVGANYTATLSFADGCNPDKTTVKVEMRDSLGDLKDITTSAYNSTTHGISISGVTGEIVITASTELKQYNVTLSGNNLLDSDYATVAVSVDGKPVTLVGGSVKVTYGKFVQIHITLKDGKQYAEGYPIYTMGSSTEGLDWDDDGILTVDSLTGDLSFVANIEKIGVSASMQYNVTIIENTISPEAIYQDEEVIYEFKIINSNAYEFDQETSKIETYVNGVLTDLTTESGVWYYDDDSGILRITISNPNTHVGIKIGHRYIEYSVTSPEDAKFYSLDVPETIHYGDKDVEIKVVADAYCHVDGVRVFLGEEELTVNVDYEYSNGVVTIKEIKGNYVIKATAAHEDVTIALDSSSDNITFTLDDPQASYPYETTITGYFSVVAPYKLPASIKVFEYGVEIGNNKYTYNSKTGVFSIKAEGNITIIAKGSLGTFEVGLSDESSANASLSPTPDPEYDEGASFEATVIVDSGYKIVSVVVKMGGSSIKAFNPYDNSIFILNLTGDVEITVVTEKIYCDVNIISYNGYSDGDSIYSIEYGLPLEVTFTPDDGYHLDEYDTFVGTMGGEDISAYYSNGVLSIPEVTGTIDVSFQGWADTYTVTTDLGESTLDTDVYVLEHGDEFFGQVTPNEGYKITSMVVTMGGNPVAVTDYGFDISFVTGNVVITVETEHITHTITNSLTNATNNNDTAEVNYGAEYIATISAKSGYENLTVKVEMGGVDVTNKYCSNGVIIIQKVTGDVVITASATAGNVNVTVNKDAGITSSIVSGSVEFDSKLEGTVSVDNFHDNLVVKVTMGGQDVTGDVYSNGSIVIENVTGNVVITLTADPMVYLVENVLDNQVHTNNDATEAAYGSNYVATLTVDNGYAITNVIVTMGNDILTDAYLDGTITINGVNGNIVIVAEVAPIEQKISNSLVNASIDNDASTINYNAPYSAVVSIDETKYENVVIKVYMNGVDVSASAVDGMNISIEHVTGPVQIVVSADPIETESAIEEVKTVAISEGEGYHEVVEAKVGYEITNVQVLVDGEDKTELYYDEATGEINIPEEVAGKVRVIKKSAPITYEISSSLTHATLSNNAQSANYGDRYVATVTAEAGYHIVSVVVKVDGVQVDSAYINGAIVLDIEGNVEITVIAEADEFTVYADCTHVLYDSEQTVVYYDGSFYADFTAEEGYENIVVTVMMNGVDVTKSVYADGVINIINGVKGNIVITASASLKHYSVTNTLTGVTTDSEVTSVNHNESYSATLASSEGYFNLTYTVTMGGNPVEVSGNTISIEHVIGNIVITASATKIELQSISASTEKTEIEYDGSLAVGDIVVVGHYNDGIDRNLECSEIANFNAKVVGEQDVTVKAGGLETTIKVTVKASEVIDHIEVSTDKPTVLYGGSFTKDDVKVTYVYTDGHKVEGQKAESISEFNNRGIGIQDITVTAAGKTAVLKVTVDGHVITSLELKGYDEYVDQNKEYTFNGSVTAHYADGSTEDIATGYEVSKLDTSKHGQQKATVTYAGVSAEFTVNVIQTETQLEPYAATAVAGGAIVGVAAISVGLFFLFKKFKI